MKNLHLGSSLLSLVVALSMLTATACSSTTSGPSGTSGAPGGTTSETTLDGTYAGTYSGDDSGPVKMTISGGDVDVVVTVGGTAYPASGSISGGQVSLGVGTGKGVTVVFDGSFANGKGSGTWRSSIGTKGAWSVAR